MKRRHSAKSLIAFLLMISVVISTGTFAYWATNVEGTVSEARSTLAIGAGNSVKTSVSISTSEESSSGYLVPASQVENSLGLVTDSVDFLYQLNWHEDQAVSQSTGNDIYGTIDSNISYEITMFNETSPLDPIEYKNIYDLMIIEEYTSNPTELLLNDSNLEEFGFSASMNEPQNQADYLIISNSSVTFYFEFYVVTDVFDLDLDFTTMTMEQLLNNGAVSPDMDNWTTELASPLESVDNGHEKYIFFPITKDEYTITINAQLDELESTRGGYGILFDTYFNDSGFTSDTGYIFQFDRGFANGEMLVRSRVNGSEKGLLWREQSTSHDYFPSKTEDPEWWVAVHEITLDITNIDDSTRAVSIYIDGTLLGSTNYDRIETDEQMYVGFRIWWYSQSDFFDLTVE